jgi:predicted tellurium resistance membrane protein TerC
MELLLDPQIWLAFVTLAVLEIVLGIDNIIFISILVGRLPRAQQARGRLIGLSLAMLTRILLLLSLTWIMRLTAPWFSIFGNEISGRDVILIAGGAFLLAKSTLEIHHSLEGEEEGRQSVRSAGFAMMMIQIAIIDIVFSLDSVITAVGLVDEIEVMIAAIIAAVLVMMAASASISRFIDGHPTIKMLALSFLIMIGIALIAEGFDLHIPKGYLYFSMAFSLGVEMLNIRLRRRAARVVQLRKSGPRRS